MRARPPAVPASASAFGAPGEPSVRLAAVLCLVVLLGGCGDAPEDEAADGPPRETRVGGSGAPPGEAGLRAGPRAEGVDLVYGRSGDRVLTGYLSRPFGAGTRSFPGVVIVPESKEVDPPTREYANRLAARGFSVLAIDVSRGGGHRRSPPQETGPTGESGAVRWTEALRQAHGFLSESAVPRGIVGDGPRTEAGAPAVGLVALCATGEGWPDLLRSLQPLFGALVLHGGPTEGAAAGSRPVGTGDGPVLRTDGGCRGPELGEGAPDRIVRFLLDRLEGDGEAASEP